MTLTEIFYILTAHWIFDFILQTDAQAKGKSSSMKDLLSHTGSYSMYWLMASCLLFGIQNIHRETSWYIWTSIIFSTVTFICHTITDYFTSRLNKRLWEKGQTHKFFISVGGDQLLHYTQLFLTFYFLTR